MNSVSLHPQSSGCHSTCSEPLSPKANCHPNPKFTMFHFLIPQIIIWQFLYLKVNRITDRRVPRSICSSHLIANQNIGCLSLLVSAETPSHNVWDKKYQVISDSVSLFIFTSFSPGHNSKLSILSSQVAFPWYSIACDLKPRSSQLTPG